MKKLFFIGNELAAWVVKVEDENDYHGTVDEEKEERLTEILERVGRFTASSHLSQTSSVYPTIAPLKPDPGNPNATKQSLI